MSRGKNCHANIDGKNDPDPFLANSVFRATFFKKKLFREEAFTIG